MNGCCFLKGPRNSLVAQQVKDPTVVPVQSLAQDLLPTIGAAKKKKKPQTIECTAQKEL